MIMDAMLTGILPVVTYVVWKKTFWLLLDHARVANKVINNFWIDGGQLLSGKPEAI